MLDIKLSDTQGVPEEIEILSYGENQSLSEAVKRAKGKYTLLCDGDAVCDTPEEFFAEVDKAQADIITFDGGFLVKTSVLKGVSKLMTAVPVSQIYAVLEAKTIAKSAFTPFKSETEKFRYSEENAVSFLAAIEEFKKSKSKLSREIYAYAVDLICLRLTEFYISALLAIKKGELSEDNLAEFDTKLKDEIVLYLAFEKRFTVESLKKLRAKNFKVGFLTYKKLLKSDK